MSDTASSDTRDLAAFGYKQELERTLGGFSAFAAGFSYISILTGIFQMFWIGFDAGGPAFFWTWPMVLVGQMLVALCFAELAAHYLLSGGVYQWSKQVGSGAVGWMAGWIYLWCLVITLAAVALALQVTMPQISALFQFIGDASNHADRARNAVLLGCVLIAFTTLINSIGVGLLAKLNNIGVFAELIGAALLIALSAANAVRGPAVVLDTHGHGAGTTLGYLGPFLAAALMASFVMYGFDTAGSLAEETNDPRKKAPRAILQALAASGVAGALLLLFGLMAARDVRAPQLATIGLPYVVVDVLGGTLGKLFLCIVIVAITACALAVHTGTVRLMFAMARDNNLPFGTALARVSGVTKTPIIPSLVAAAGAAGILLVNAVSPSFIDLVVPIAILWANLAYLLVNTALLRMRLKGWPGKGGSGVSGVFALGSWGLPVNILAVLWSVFMIVNIGWPRARPVWYEQYGAILLTLALVALGGAYYWLVQRHKTGVLPEHRAAIAILPGHLAKLR